VSLIISLYGVFAERAVTRRKAVAEYGKLDFVNKLNILDFKLSPCTECCMLSFG